MDSKNYNSEVELSENNNTKREEKNNLQMNYLALTYLFGPKFTDTCKVYS
jgi:hypothetical protein